MGKLKMPLVAKLLFIGSTLDMVIMIVRFFYDNNTLLGLQNIMNLILLIMIMIGMLKLNKDLNKLDKE